MIYWRIFTRCCVPTLGRRRLLSLLILVVISGLISTVQYFDVRIVVGRNIQMKETVSKAAELVPPLKETASKSAECVLPFKETASKTAECVPPLNETASKTPLKETASKSAELVGLPPLPKAIIPATKAITSAVVFKPEFYTSPCHDTPSAGDLKETYNATQLQINMRSLKIIQNHLAIYIAPAMSSWERQAVTLILQEFKDICQRFKFVYFIFSGTLLGSYRHHGLQPWDDDVDFLMRANDRERAIDVFTKYGVHSSMLFFATRMKIFHKTRSRHYRSPAVIPYRWPFLDISFYYENVTHIWEEWLNTGKKYNEFQKRFIFPLHLRPFEKVWLSSPRDAFGILKSQYSDPRCRSLTWVHRRELPPARKIWFECDLVASIYPFIHRKTIGFRCVEETAVVNGTVLYSVLVREPGYAISKPYVLELINQQNRSPSTKNPRKRIMFGDVPE